MIKKLSELDNALWKRISQIVQTENRPFSYVDFVPSFIVDGQNYTIAYGTFRNKMSKMLKAEKVEVVYSSPQAFYTLKGVKSETAMTGDHTGVSVSVLPSPPPLHSQLQRHRLANDPVYRIIQNLPFSQRTLHDIHLRFEVQGIWSIISSQYEPNPMSKDIQLRPPWPWKIRDFDIKVTVHSTDTVGVDIGCSYRPVVVDVSGVIRLSNALCTVQERLSNIISYGSGSVADASTICIIPDHMSWTVTLWHFGMDALCTYAGDKFYVSWEIAQHALVTVYSKDWTDGKSRIRIEKQEYPKKSLAEALEEKLNANTASGGGG
jgi:hypothetical protein